MIPFPPVLEDFHQEGEAFLSSMHYNKHAFDIPWMVGMTTEEGLIECSGGLEFYCNLKITEKFF